MANWIKIHNDFFGDNKVTYDESYFYSYLFRNRVVYDNSTITSIDLIHNHMSYQFIKGDEQKNKKYIRNIILSLISKSYISCIINDKTKYSDILIISYPYESTKGHNQNVTYGVYDSFEDPLKYYVYCYIDCFGDKGRDISDGKWIELIGKSKTKIRQIINEMDGQCIYKFSGDYYHDLNGRPKQNINTYYTRPSDDMVNLYNSYKLHISNKKDIVIPAIVDKKDKVKTKDQDNLNVNNVDGQIIVHNWYNKDVYPDVNDYYIYLTTNDTKLKSDADKRMAALSKSEFGKSKVNENMKDAEFKVKSEIRKNNDSMIDSMVKEHGHAVKLKSGYVCLVGDIDDWNQVESFSMQDKDEQGYYGNDNKFRISESKFSPHTEELRQFIIDELVSIGELNADIYSGIASKWRQYKGIE